MLPTHPAGGSLGGTPWPPPHCCYLGFNKDFLRMPVLPVVLEGGGLWGVLGGHLSPVTCCTVASLDPRPRRELGQLIRAPRVPHCHGTACKQPRAAPQHWVGAGYQHPTAGGALLPALCPPTPQPWGRSCSCYFPPCPHRVPVMLPPVLGVKAGHGDPRQRVGTGVSQELPVIAVAPGTGRGGGGGAA